MKKTNRTTGTKQKQGALLDQALRTFEFEKESARRAVELAREIDARDNIEFFSGFAAGLTKARKIFEPLLPEAARGGNSKLCGEVRSSDSSDQL